MKKNLLKICLMTMLAGAGVATARAEVFTVDGINYTLLEDGSGVEVAKGSYKGDMTIPAVVKNGAITYKVVGVGEYAFQDAEVTSVKLPNTVRIIKKAAFNGSDIVTLDMGTGIEEIQDNALSVARDLENLSELPAGCVKLGAVFGMNDKLKAINVEDGNPMYKSIDGVLYTASGKTALAYPVGRGTEYDIPEGVDSIAIDFMNTNQAMARVTFPSTLKYVGRSAFVYCTSMVTNDLPEGLEYIGSSAFSNCRKMAANVPASVKSIGMSAFNNGWAIKSVKIGNKLETWGNQAFYQNKVLESIEIEPYPENVKKIPDFSFQNSGPIKEIVIPEGYTEIGGYAFSNCSSAKYIDIASTVETIDVAAFSNINADKIVVRAAVPPTYTNQSYYLFGNKNLDTVPVYVPDESIEAYKSAWMWKFFKNYLPLSGLAGIDDVADGDAVAVSTRYFNLQGIEVPAPGYADGKAYIVKTTYDNGKVETKKYVNR